MMECIIRAGFRWTVALLLCLATQNGIADGVAMMGMCSKCHGEDGVSMDPKYPTIAGIPAEIQEDALYAYRDGGRNCESAPMMCKMVKKLTDDQIVEMSAHFSAMPFRPAEQDFDADLATKGEALHNENCQACHGDGPEEADSSILHGQWADYLRYTLAQYVAGVREQPPNMKKRTDELTEADIDALVNFYASYR